MIKNFIYLLTLATCCSFGISAEENKNLDNHLAEAKDCNPQEQLAGCRCRKKKKSALFQKTQDDYVDLDEEESDSLAANEKEENGLAVHNSEEKEPEFLANNESEKEHSQLAHHEEKEPEMLATNEPEKEHNQFAHHGEEKEPELLANNENEKEHDRFAHHGNEQENDPIEHLFAAIGEENLPESITRDCVLISLLG